MVVSTCQGATITNAKIQWGDEVEHGDMRTSARGGSLPANG
jgi:hypothetical protein